MRSCGSVEERKCGIESIFGLLIWEGYSEDFLNGSKRIVSHSVQVSEIS